MMYKLHGDHDSANSDQGLKKCSSSHGESGKAANKK